MELLMSIRVICKHCDAKLNVAEKHQGKKTNCPKCEKPLTIPVMQSDEDDDEYGDEYVPSVPPKMARKKKRPEVAPKDRPQKPKRRPEDYAQEEGCGMFNAGLLPGILMMVGAVIWFFVGLQAGTIFFYPPILFIAGMISFVRGLAE